MKIYVEVRGGVVGAVYTDTDSNPVGVSVEAVVVDYDNIEAGDEAPDQPDEANRYYVY